MFSLSRASGDPRNLYLDEYATDEMYEAWGVKLGLDKPLYVQYLTWLGDVMVGDFGESLIKRQADIKDTSSFLMGHGGFLDRFDSLAFAAPAYYMYISAFII